MTMLEAALLYAMKGMSVVPVKEDKKPLIKWEPYQKRRASEDEIRAWFKKSPSANIGIVTGEISNLLVVDTDTQESTKQIQEAIPDSLVVPCQKTPSGGIHFFFSHSPGFSNRARVADGIDIRTSGGYVVVDPSINGNGNKWKWIVSLLDAYPPPYIINSITSLFNSLYLYRGVYKDKNTTSLQMSTESTNVYKMFLLHSRNQDLFHVALQLFKGKTRPEVITEVIEKLGGICDPPWGSQKDDGPIGVIIESAWKYHKGRERNLAVEVKEELLSTEGDFLSTELEKCLQLSTREEKKNLSIILKRLSEEENPIIKRKGTRRGAWTTIDNTIKTMNFLDVDLSNTVRVSLPLGIDKKTVFFPKSVILLAGVTGFGKTTFALNFIKNNWDRYCPIYYFNSEMSPESLNKKLSYFKDNTIEEWSKKMIAIEGWDYRNIASKIFPDGINVIDYLEPEGEKSFNIHGVIVDIINRLEQGLAFITIQKRPNVDLGTGGIYSIKAASLALNLEWGSIKIYKNRFREEDPRPDLDAIDFDITHGAEFQKRGDWYNSRMGKRNRYKDFTSKED